MTDKQSYNYFRSVRNYNPDQTKLATSTDRNTSHNSNSPNQTDESHINVNVNRGLQHQVYRGKKESFPLAADTRRAEGRPDGERSAQCLAGVARPGEGRDSGGAVSPMPSPMHGETEGRLGRGRLWPSFPWSLATDTRRAEGRPGGSPLLTDD